MASKSVFNNRKDNLKPGSDIDQKRLFRYSKIFSSVFIFLYNMANDFWISFLTQK